MAKSQQTFNKKEKEKKRLKKREIKAQKKEERQANSQGGDLDNMMAYLDEYGNITDTPPDPTVKKEEIDPSTINIGVPKMEDMDEQHKGRVAFFNEEKGFGFIKDMNKRDEYFVHVNGLIDRIKEHDVVTFDLEQGPKGKNAVNVKKKV